MEGRADGVECEDWFFCTKGDSADEVEAAIRSEVADQNQPSRAPAWCGPGQQIQLRRSPGQLVSEEVPRRLGTPPSKSPVLPSAAASSCSSQIQAMTMWPNASDTRRCWPRGVDVTGANIDAVTAVSRCQLLSN